LYRAAVAAEADAVAAAEGAGESDERTLHAEKLAELRSRISNLYGEVMDWTGPLTSDQEAQLDYYKEMLGRLAG
ncbi:MAG TPA: hypothetical protein VFI91_11670, partial [Longimicrobiaceae bacterium]|nr:hypothetical protein [Longimicrobiaceae bacterium]